MKFIGHEIDIETLMYSIFIVYSIILLAFGIMLEGVLGIYQGMHQIIQSPSQLLTDYIVVANLGSVFFNSGLMTLISTLIAVKKKIPGTGLMIAALFSVSGFSFFGKNLYNSIPIFIGVLLYAKLVKESERDYIITGYFGSSLSPVVSYMTFGLGLGFLKGMILGMSVGLFIGLILPRLAKHCKKFHKGYSLYNVGFTSGFLAMILTNLLRLSGWEIEDTYLVSSIHSRELFLFLFCVFLGLFLIGWYVNEASIAGMKRIFQSTGREEADFSISAGLGATFMNMAIFGVGLIMYVCFMGGVFSGPIVGAVLTATGFAAYGNHLGNSLPILIGVVLASLLAPIHMPDQTVVLMAAIFGTTLAPISGKFGFVPGILAGFIHLSLVTNVTYLHAGLNLYNNGFAGGFVAAFLVPLLQESIFTRFSRERVENI